MSVILAHFHWPFVPVLQWVQLPQPRRKIKIRLSLLHNEVHSRQDLCSLHLSKKGTVEINTQLQKIKDIKRARKFRTIRYIHTLRIFMPLLEDCVL